MATKTANLLTQLKKIRSAVFVSLLLLSFLLGAQTSHLLHASPPPLRVKEVTEAIKGTEGVSLIARDGTYCRESFFDPKDIHDFNRIQNLTTAAYLVPIHERGGMMRINFECRWADRDWERVR